MKVSSFSSLRTLKPAVHQLSQCLAEVDFVYLTMCIQLQFSGPNAHQTILTLPTDERWKAVRKAVATAFSTTNMRANFPGEILDDPYLVLFVLFCPR